MPEILEAILQGPGPSGRQLAGHQRVELDAGFSTHPTAPTQQLPAHVFEPFGQRLAFEPGTPAQRPVPAGAQKAISYQLSKH